jgi:hypothetical protein
VKAFLGNLLSGIVGGIAWELGPTVGAAVWPPFGWSQSGNYRETGFEEIEARRHSVSPTFPRSGLLARNNFRIAPHSGAIAKMSGMATSAVRRLGDGVTYERVGQRSDTLRQSWAKGIYTTAIGRHACFGQEELREVLEAVPGPGMRIRPGFLGQSIVAGSRDRGQLVPRDGRRPRWKGREKNQRRCLCRSIGT